MFNEIVKFTKSHKRFAITSHARPDGDSIGSALGLALALKELGKTAHVYNADRYPRAFSSMPGIEQIRFADRLSGQYEAVFVLECNNLSRAKLADLSRYYSINIDHHPGTQPFGNLNWVDTSAAAVGEMIYRLIRALEVQLTPEISTNLYVAILTDTGSFQFSNTRAQTFQIARELVVGGANPSRIAQDIYMSQPHSKIRLLAQVLGTLQLHPSKKIAWIVLTREMLEQAAASADETEGIVNYALFLEGVEMAAFFREENQEHFRVSLRSKRHYDVGSVARIFGGGGHRATAGLSMEGSFPEVLDRVIGELERLLDRHTEPRSVDRNLPKAR